MQEPRITREEFATRVVIALMKKIGIKKRAQTDMPAWGEAMKGERDSKKFIRLHGRIFGMLFFLFFACFAWFYVLYTCAHPESDVKHAFNQHKITAPTEQKPGASPSQQPAAPSPTIDAPTAAAPAPTAPAADAAAPIPPPAQPAMQGNQFGAPAQQPGMQAPGMQPIGGGAVYAAQQQPMGLPSAYQQVPQQAPQPVYQQMPVYEQAQIQVAPSMPTSYTVYTTTYSNTGAYGTVPPPPMPMQPQVVSHNSDFCGTYNTPTGRFKVIAPR